MPYFTPPQATLSGHAPFAPDTEYVVGQHGAGTLYMQPVDMPEAPVQFDRVLVPVNISNATNSSFSHTLSMSVGFYTRSGDTLSLLQSGSATYAMTASGTVGSYSLWGGVRHMSIAMTNTITSPVWVGIWSRTTTGGGAGQTINALLATAPNSSWSGILGAATNATDQMLLGMGRYSVSFTTAMPTSVGFTQIQGNSSILQRPPQFIMASGTV